MGLGRASSSLALLILLTSTCSEASFIYRVPKDGDSCSTYRFTSSNVWFATFLRRVFGDLPCGPGQVINSAGQCVDRDDDVADRCRDPAKFDDSVVDRICSRLPSARFADPLNCTWYYDCSLSERHVQCPFDHVTQTYNNYDDVSKMCAPSTEVMCGIRPVSYSRKLIAAMCSADPRRMIINADNCNAYYDCSMPNDPTGRFLPYDGECPYLQLLDTETKECRPSREVVCHLRNVVKNPCELKQNSCGQGHCRPCHVTQPDCTEQQDGDRPFKGQLFTPKYAKCLDGWTLGVGTCQPMVNARGLQEPRVFDARKNECESVFNIPRSLGGMGDEEN